MKVECEGKVYVARYFPFFRIKKGKGFQTFGIRYPSGFIETIIISDNSAYLDELRSYLAYLIKEYLIEETDMLTPYAQRLKKDIGDLFGE